jgi:hypothetical protein
MKIALECDICRKHKGGKSYSIYYINEENIFENGCMKMHHRSILILTNTKHELLFEAGLRAINDYYLREGVTSIAASLERFYEFGVKVIFENLDNELLFESIWKEVKNQSERQIGAFLYSYTLIFNEKPKILSQKMSEFRNKVVHKGYFPSIEETIQFVKEVREIFAIVDEKISAPIIRT